MAKMLALDPGVTTGVAVLDDDGKYQISQIRLADYPHPHEMLHDMICSLKPQKIIYEQFHFRQGMDGAVFTGIEYIGAAELTAQLIYAEVVKITPSDGKGFWVDKKLKAIGLYKTGLPHGMDALRVLLRHRMKTDKAFMEEMLPKLKENL